MNAEDSMHCGAMDPDCMQWSPCSEAQCIPMECSGFYAAWPKASRLNAVDYMQDDCSRVIHYAAVKSMQSVKMHPDGMQWIPCSVKKWNILNAVDIMQHD